MVIPFLAETLNVPGLAGAPARTYAAGLSDAAKITRGWIVGSSRTPINRYLEDLAAQLDEAAEMARRGSHPAMTDNRAAIGSMLPGSYADGLRNAAQRARHLFVTEPTAQPALLALGAWCEETADRVKP